MGEVSPGGCIARHSKGYAPALPKSRGTVWKWPPLLQHNGLTPMAIPLATQAKLPALAGIAAHKVIARDSSGPAFFREVGPLGKDRVEKWLLPMQRNVLTSGVEPLPSLDRDLVAGALLGAFL